MAKPLTCILVTVQNAGETTEMVVTDSQFFIGRSTECAVSIKSASVSRHHLLVKNKGGKVWIEDQGSSNGTTLNGQPLQGKRLTPITPRDAIMLGSSINVAISPVLRALTEEVIEEARIKDEDKDSLMNLIQGAHAEAKRLVEAGKEMHDGYIRTGEETAAAIERKMIANFEQVMGEATAKATAILEDAQKQHDDLLAQLHEDAAKLKAIEVEKILSEAQLKAAELKNNTEYECAGLKARTEKYAAELKAKAERETSELRAKAGRESSELKTKAEREAAELKARTEKESDDLITRTERAAADLTARTEKVASDLKTRSEREAADLKAKTDLETTELRAKTEREAKELKLKTEKETSELKARTEKAAADLREKTERETSEQKAKIDRETAGLKEKLDKEHTLAIAETKRQTDALLAEAKKQSEAIVSEAKQQAEGFLNEAKRESNDLMAKAHQKSETDARERRARHDADMQAEHLEKIKKLEAEIRNQRDKQNQDFNQLRLEQLEELKRERAKVVAEFARERQEIGKVILSQAEAVALKNISTAAWEPIAASIAEALNQNFVGANDGQTSEDAISPLVAKVNRQRMRTRVVWTLQGFFVGMLLWIGVERANEFIHNETSPMKSAAEEEAQRMQAELAQRKFDPPQDDEWRETYTDLVIYTRDFTQKYLADDFQKRWQKTATKYFIKKWRVEEDTVLQVIAKLNALVSALSESRKGIHPDFVKSGVQKMKDLETATMSDVKNLLGSAVRIEALKQIEKKAFAEYYSQRSPATDSNKAGDEEQNEKELEP